jgi:hypothetical protein
MITTDLANAEKFSLWLKERGSIALWHAIDFSGDSCFTPALTDGKPTRKPHWKYPNEPQEIITDPDTITLQTSKEVKRFHIAVRLGANGIRVKVTDASSAHINRTLEKLGDRAFYEFDYSTQEAVFYLPDSTITLTEWRKVHEKT